MTREQQVALDAMRSAWPEEVVQRMLRAERPDAYVTRERALDAIFRMSNWQHGYGQRRLATTADCVRCLDFSPPETPTATSTHRPPEETEQRGGLTVRRGAPVCPHCRDTEERVDCGACGGSGLADLADVRPDVAQGEAT